MTEKVCCECGQPLDGRCSFHNLPQEEPMSAGDFRIRLRDQNFPMWKFMDWDEAAHLECYIDRCVQNALERLAK